jgi:hypothetical protein
MQYGNNRSFGRHKQWWLRKRTALSQGPSFGEEEPEGSSFRNSERSRKMRGTSPFIAVREVEPGKKVPILFEPRDIFLNSSTGINRMVQSSPNSSSEKVRNQQVSMMWGPIAI